MMIPSRVENSPSDQGNLNKANSHLLDALIFAKVPGENTLPLPSTSTDYARRYLMVALVENFPLAQRAWEAGGLVANREHHNIIEHQVTVGLVGYILAIDAGYTGAMDNLVNALLAHDADRIIEADALQKAAEKAQRKKSLGIQNATGTLYAKNLFLAPIMGETVAQLAKAVVPNSPEGWDDLAYKIMHLADALCDGSIITHPAERAKRAAGVTGSRRSGIVTVRDAAHEKRLGMAPGEYRKLQVTLALKEAEEIISLIQANHPESHAVLHTVTDLPAYITKRIEEEGLSLLVS